MFIYKGDWRQVPWPYNSEITDETWSIKCGHGTICLRNKGSFPYTASFGPNSDYSHSGCFYNCPDIQTIEDAKACLLLHDFQKCPPITETIKRFMIVKQRKIND